MTRRLASALLAGACVVLAAHTASAAEESGAQSPKRAMPDYDGRGPDPSERDGAGTWTARVLLSPLYFLTEFILRRPLGALVTAAERGDVANKLYDFFTFGPGHSTGFYPIGFAAFGFLPSVGVYAFADDVIVKHNDVRLHVEAWPVDWAYGSLTDRYTMSGGRSLRFRASTLVRPDMVFYGTGPTTLESNKSRYSERHFDANAAFIDRFWRQSEVLAVAGVRKVETSHGHFGNDPSVEVSAANGVFALPWGFDRGYTAPYANVTAALDTRAPHGSRTGLRVEGTAEEGIDTEHAGTSWVRYGAAAAVHMDLTGHERVLTLKGGVIFADPLSSSQQVPFTELVTLGGEKWMRGYFPGRLVDRSAAIIELSYAWPIAASFEATIHADLGNVFGPHLDGFKPELLRFSGALGLANKGGSPPFEFVVGFGTETFKQGANVDSIRITVGVPLSF